MADASQKREERRRIKEAELKENRSHWITEEKKI